MAVRETLARSFESGADDYDALRPHFPAVVFDTMEGLCDAQLHGRVLEIGAGTGRATLPLARIAAQLTVVEPSADMLRVLGARLDAANLGHHVALRHCSFEQIDPVHETYDVVVAAQSFHWANPESRWQRLEHVLAPDGLAFLFWNGWNLRSQHVIAAVERVYQRHDAEVPTYIGSGSPAASSSWVDDEIAQHPGLRTRYRTVFTWPWSMPRRDYTRLLATTSAYATMPTHRRQELLDDLELVLSDQVDLAGSTLFLAVERA